MQCSISIITVTYYLNILTHFRIRSAIERKEENILELKKKYERVSDHCNHLEALLQRQTKESYMKDVKMTKNTRL